MGTFSEHANALQHVDDVAVRCGLKAFHDLSDKFAGSRPGYVVVVAGPFVTREDADHMLQIAKKCVPDAFLRYREYAAEMSVQPPPGSPGPTKSETSSSAIPSDAKSSLAYRQGQADRQSWESWFAALSGGYRSGAEYWAAHRGSSNPGSCSARPPSTGDDWTAGCFAAQQRLAHADVRRKTEPEYRLGWNNPETRSSSPVTAPPTAAQKPAEKATAQRVASPRMPSASSQSTDASHGQPGQYVLNSDGDLVCGPFHPNVPFGQPDPCYQGQGTLPAGVPQPPFEHRSPPCPGKTGDEIFDKSYNMQCRPVRTHFDDNFNLRIAETIRTSVEPNPCRSDNGCRRTKSSL